MAENGIEEVIKNFEEEVEKSEELAKTEEAVKSDEEAKEEEEKETEKSADEEEDKEEDAEKSEEEDEDKKKKKKKSEEKEEDEEEKEDEETAKAAPVEEGDEEVSKDNHVDEFNERLSKSLELVIKSYQANAEQLDNLRQSVDGLVDRIAKSESEFEEFTKSFDEVKEEAVAKSLEEVVEEEAPTAKSVNYAAKNAIEDSETEATEKSAQVEEQLVFNDKEATRRLVEKSNKGELTRAKQEEMRKSILNLMEGNFEQNDISNVNDLMN